MDSPTRTHLLESLLDLANDASTYLRGHAQPAVRVSAALLVAAALAACNGNSAPPQPGSTAASAVQPLNQEVRLGLPAQPGRYPVADGSLTRDAQGVYHFTWLSGSDRHDASVSRLQLAQSDNDVLEVPVTGDPVLYLRSQTSIPLMPIGGGFGGGGYGGYGLWRPFYGVGFRAPGDYDPPSQAIPQGGTLDGSRVSSAPAPPDERTVGLPHTVSGRAGGTGSGQAASRKSGAGTSSGEGEPAGAARSGGFSSGRGGGEGGSAS